MKKSEWDYLSKAMWSYSEKHEGTISSLLKELIQLVNLNLFTENIEEVNIYDNDENDEITRSNGTIDSDSTNNFNFEGTGEF